MTADVPATPPEHKITIEHADGRSKYGRLKRTYWPECTCGWEHPHASVQKWVAVERGNEHLGQLACSNCGTTKPEEKVAHRSWDLDLPSLLLCSLCAYCVTAQPDMFLELEGRRRV